MAPKGFTPGFPMHAFSSPSALAAFFSANHLTLPGFYLKLAKKSSLIPSVTFAEATEVALCYGWIDGGGLGIDDKWWSVRYTPRRSKSIWSKKNVDTVERMIEEGKMTPAGLEVVEAAKKDGRWEPAYAGPSTIQEPDDFKAALAENAKARTFFAGLKSSQRYSVLWRIETSSVNTRAKKIAGFVEMLAKEELPPLLGGTKKREKEVTTGRVNKTKARTTAKAVAARDQKAIVDRIDKNAPERPVRRAGLRARP